MKKLFFIFIIFIFSFIFLPAANIQAQENLSLIEMNNKFFLYFSEYGTEVVYTPSFNLFFIDGDGNFGQGYGFGLGAAMVFSPEEGFFIPVLLPALLYQVEVQSEYMRNFPILLIRFSYILLVSLEEDMDLIQGNIFEFDIGFKWYFKPEEKWFFNVALGSMFWTETGDTYMENNVEYVDKGFFIINLNLNFSFGFSF